MADLAQLEESIVGLSLLEAAQLVKKLEERLGVSAAAAAPVMVAGGGGGGGGGGSGGREDRIHRRPERSGRQQDQCNQGRPRSHQPGLERSQGTGRRRAEERKRRRFEGRSGDHQEEVHRRGRGGRSKVSRSCGRGRPSAASRAVRRGLRLSTGQPRQHVLNRTGSGAKSFMLRVLTCEPWAAMLASILTSLPWDSLERERSSRREVWAGCSAGRRGGNRPRNWRERIQIKKGETPWLASAGTTVPAGAPLSFQVLFKVPGCSGSTQRMSRGAKRPTHSAVCAAFGCA